MAVSTGSDFVDFIIPMWDRLKLYDSTKSPTDQPENDAADPGKAIPQGFIDAMIVREEVFVKEQKVPLENELDEDDRRSFHWVAYVSMPAKQTSPDIKSQDGKSNVNPNRRVSTSTKVPVGTIRLVPPPHGPHPHPKPSSHRKSDALDGEGRKDSMVVHDGKEAYIKLGRMAVIKDLRGYGISDLLLKTALKFAAENPSKVTPDYDPTWVEAMKQEYDRGARIEWKGLVLLHAQVGVQKLYRKYGFETDESMGVWNEEGIDHVAMWKRLDIRGRRKSQPSLGSPLASP